MTDDVMISAQVVEGRFIMLQRYLANGRVDEAKLLIIATLESLQEILRPEEKID